jgi:4-hydroxybenzoate polyprenyltransferase
LPVKKGRIDAIPYITLLRPHQYVKSLFIFAPPFFAVKVTDVHLPWNTLITFITLSFTASSLYVLIDYIDVSEDREHPVKRDHPFASGAVTKTEALFFMAVLLAAGTGMTFTQGAGIHHV